ncbi:uncharacterized protein LOC112690037 [Sipha flava]|uniref:Uncharacterized protein LOC112690037 n=1 Tax=Sipha flava TaxID=143950 RepID=A0A2S2R7V9_9HEMI|nr:uncharacterized protein LOC112690037 [Sipha flava]
MFKRAATLTAVVVAAATCAVLAAAQVPDGTAADRHSWTEVIECYRRPQAAIGCLESRMGRAVLSLRESAVRLARSDPDVVPEDAAAVGDLVQQVGEFITYGVSSFFRGDAADHSVAATGESPPLNVPADADEGRGHHKKKKIQKEIKKFVLKVLFGIYLFKQKIKMILMSIQSILMSKFLVVAMIYALSNTFKIWYDIKSSKHHHHDKVVYYENAHHQHHYEPPEHTEYDDHHEHHGWDSGSIWGRSIVATEPSSKDPSGSRNGISRYIRRVTRTATRQPSVTAQTMAFGAQKPAQQ